MTDGISVIIPSYQEAENLRNILPTLHATLKGIGVPYEILCVDTMEKMDDTEEVCASCGATYVKRQGGNNYGDAIRTGFASARYSYTVVMDGDGSHDPKYIKDFYEAIGAGYDLIIGSRYTKGGTTDNPLILKAMSYILNVTYRVFFGIKAKDISDSFRMYRTEQIQNLSLQCDNFDIVEEILIKLSMSKKGYAIKEIPICFEKRREGRSKRKLGKFILSYLQTIGKLKKMKTTGKKVALVENNTTPLVYAFSFLIIAFFIVHFLLLVKNPYGIQRYLYFIGLGDLFADFFNPVIQVAEKNPYPINFWVVYLPLVYMFFYPFSKFDSFAQFSLGNCYLSKLGMLALVFYLLFLCGVFIHSMCCLCNRYKTNKIIILSALLSFVTLHTLERANIILLTTSLLFYFLAFYDSKNKAFRYFGAICLVLASVGKIYPVLFGVLYLDKKQYREIVFCVILGIILTFLPFLFFKNGFSNIHILLQNLKDFSKNVEGQYHSRYVVYRIFRFITKNESFSLLMGKLSRWFFVVASLLSILLSVFVKNYFRKLFLIVMAVLYLPQTSVLYCTLYIIPLVILFFSDTAVRTKKDIPLAIYFLFVLFPLQFIVHFTNGAGNIEGFDHMFFINICSICAFLCCISTSLRSLYLSAKGKEGRDINA